MRARCPVSSTGRIRRPASSRWIPAHAVLRENCIGPAGSPRLYEIKINGDATALIRDVQFHPVTDAPEHVDFQPVWRLASRSAFPCRCTPGNDGLSPGIISVAGIAERDPPHRREEGLPAGPGSKFRGASHRRSGCARLHRAAVRWQKFARHREHAQPVIARNFVVATVAPPTKQCRRPRPRRATSGTAALRLPQ